MVCCSSFLAGLLAFLGHSFNSTSAFANHPNIERMEKTKTETFCIVFVAEADDSEYFPVTAHVGDNLTLYCNTSLAVPVDWLYNSFRVYDKGYVHHARFTVDDNVTGQYNLIMPNIQLNDSGQYSCVEDIGQGRSRIYIVTIAGIAIQLVAFSAIQSAVVYGTVNILF